MDNRMASLRCPKKNAHDIFFGKKEIVREWAACVHSQWAVFPAKREAATDEDHGPAAMRVVVLRESTVVADGGPAFWARVGKSTGLIVIWWPSGRLGQGWARFWLEFTFGGSAVGRLLAWRSLGPKGWQWLEEAKGRATQSAGV